ncbi:MAG: hypothetical protein KAF40_03970 [Flavihumibacter sp.]|nr:hypothetical protein [Flavihumibacter sp.]
MLKETAAAILEDSIKLKITGDEKHSWFWWKTKRVTREFEIRPLTLGSLIRISRIILSIDPEIFNKERILEALYGAADKHGTELARVVAIAFTNSRREPADSLISFIQESITTPQLKEVLGVIILQMDVRSFMSSIVSIRGMNLLTMKTNPVDQGSQIASGALSEGG